MDAYNRGKEVTLKSTMRLQVFNMVAEPEQCACDVAWRVAWPPNQAGHACS